jgi:hypothetical protein
VRATRSTFTNARAESPSLDTAASSSRRESRSSSTTRSRSALASPTIDCTALVRELNAFLERVGREPVVLFYTNEVCPVLELLVLPEGSGARIYVAGWCPPAVRLKLDSQKGARLSAFPDPEDLQKFMWGADAPYISRGAGRGIEIQARGRAAIVLGEWIVPLTNVHAY